MSAWSKFKVGTPATNGFNNNCRRFATISHTSHIESAFSILERGEISPHLVFDESVLNTRRILVTWLSPNDWGSNFRYGNVRFDFDFKKLIAGKRFYWVEDIAYKIAACRILVTDTKHDELDVYDPTTKMGPWWHDVASDEHYFNGNHCLEFMFECAISLKDIRIIDFVGHHPDFCSIHRTNPGKCKERGYGANRGSAMFIARAVASGTSLESLAAHFIFEKNGRPSNALDFAFDDLRYHAFKKIVFNGGMHAMSVEATAISQAICSAISFQQTASARTLASLFCSEEEFASALAMAVSNVVQLKNWVDLMGSDYLSKK